MNHVKRTIESANLIKHPFNHLYIENFLPKSLYKQIKFCAFDCCDAGEFIQTRKQDSKQFVNSRLNVYDRSEFAKIRKILENKKIMSMVLLKFYKNVTKKTLNKTQIHKKEFEFVYTCKDRFQNIHIDMPFKLLSFVFYFPKMVNLDQETQLLNATIMYDKLLKPHHSAKFKDNTVVIFAPHFYSYHGFNTTIDRMVMLCFYRNDKWLTNGDNENIKEATEKKIKELSLKEYTNDSKIAIEKQGCKINAPFGRVMKNNL